MEGTPGIAGSLGVRHQLLVSRVINLAAELVVEREREVETVGGELCAESAVSDRHAASLRIAGGTVDVGGRLVPVGSRTVGHTGAQLGVDVVERLALLVHSGILGKELVVDGTALDIPQALFDEAAGQRGLRGGEAENLVLVVCDIERQAPVDVLRADGRADKAQLDT